MSATLHEDLIFQTAINLASNSTGDKAVIRFPVKCEVIESGVNWEVSSTHATAAIIKVDKRVLTLSDTGRGDGDVAVIKKVASVNKLGLVTIARPAARVVMQPGMEAVFEVTTANGDACAFSGYIKVRQIPEHISNMAGTAGTTSGAELTT